MLIEKQYAGIILFLFLFTIMFLLIIVSNENAKKGPLKISGK
jgi:hypothetical protein